MTYAGYILFCYLTLFSSGRETCTPANADIIIYSASMMHPTRDACMADLAQAFEEASAARSALRRGDTVVVNCGFAFETMGK